MAELELLAPDPRAVATAHRAFAGIQAGARTGDWDGFLGLLDPDVGFYTPTPQFHGWFRGIDAVRELVALHRGELSTEATLRRTLANGGDVALEVRAEGRLRGEEYANQLCMVFAVRDGRIVQLRWHSAALRFRGIADGRDAFDDGLPIGAPGQVLSDAVRLEPHAEEDLATAYEILGAIQEGARTGTWERTLGLVRDDFSMWVPVPGMYGFHRGREAAERLFGHHSTDTRTVLEPKQVLVNGNEVAFELRAEGEIEGKPYANQLFMLFRVRDGGWQQFREYCACHGGWDDVTIAREAWEPRPVTAGLGT